MDGSLPMGPITLRQMRERLKLSQAALAYELGVSVATIQRLERAPTADRVYLLAVWALLSRVERGI
jgi:DNA-binding transcriptional regulator YiaG